MKTGAGLGLIAVGAILAFAVTAHPRGLNLQAAGWVLIVIGLAGMFVPRRGYGWLRRRVVRRTPRRTAVLARRGRGAGNPAGAVVLAPEEADEIVTTDAEPEVFPGRTISKAEAEEMAPTTPMAGNTETIEEYREE
jgi:Domain of unknown function (DUF6458)